MAARSVLNELIKYQARVQGGGGLAPPLEIEKQKKKKKKVIRANIKLFHLYFAIFLVENVIFSASFSAGPSPGQIEKQKKKLSDFGPPLLRIPGHAPEYTSCPVRSCPVRSCPVRSCPVRSCPVRSCPVRSCPVRSCPVRSCPVDVL